MNIATLLADPETKCFGSIRPSLNGITVVVETTTPRLIGVDDFAFRRRRR